MNATFAALSNNFMYAATAVFALAMLAPAAAGAFIRERRTGKTAARAEAPALVAVGAPSDMRAEPDAAAPPESDGAVDRAALFGRIGSAVTVVATFLLGCGVLTRGLAAERVPWSNLYEFTTTG